MKFMRDVGKKMKTLSIAAGIAALAATAFYALPALTADVKAADTKPAVGKPEPLRENLKGWWSRRITVSDRLVYRVSGKPPDQVLEILQCRFHY